MAKTKRSRRYRTRRGGSDSDIEMSEGDEAGSGSPLSGSLRSRSPSSPSGSPEIGDDEDVDDAEFSSSLSERPWVEPPKRPKTELVLPPPKNNVDDPNADFAEDPRTDAEITGYDPADHVDNEENETEIEDPANELVGYDGESNFDNPVKETTPGVNPKNDDWFHTKSMKTGMWYRKKCKDENGFNRYQNGKCPEEKDGYENVKGRRKKICGNPYRTANYERNDDGRCVYKTKNQQPNKAAPKKRTKRSYSPSTPQDKRSYSPEMGSPGTPPHSNIVMTVDDRGKYHYKCVPREKDGIAKPGYGLTVRVDKLSTNTATIQDCKRVPSGGRRRSRKRR